MVLFPLQVTVLNHPWQQSLSSVQEAFGLGGGSGAGMLAQSQRGSRKLRWVGDMQRVMSASNFLVTGQCTPDDFFFSFFPLNTDHHGATTFFLFLFFFLKNLKEAFL